MLFGLMLRTFDTVQRGYGDDQRRFVLFCALCDGFWGLEMAILVLDLEIAMKTCFLF